MIKRFKRWTRNPLHFEWREYLRHLIYNTQLYVWITMKIEKRKLKKLEKRVPGISSIDFMLRD